MLPLGLLPTLLIYGAFGAGLAVATSWGMPALQAVGFRADVSWFIAAGIVFAAFVLLTVAMLRREGPEARRAWRKRLRIHPMSGDDWRTALAGLGLAFAGSGLAFLACAMLIPGFSPHPPFLEMHPLRPSEYWVLLAWLPMFTLNILGEELFGRGYLLPRNEVAAGRFGWVVNGCGWLLFHAAFGPVLMAITAPVIFAVCWAAQQSRNTTVGIVIHGLVNGLGFLSISLGLMPA